MRVPKSPAIKICGITDLNQAKAIANLNVDAIGVVGVKESKRFVPNQQRREIFSSLASCSKGIERVWVVADLNDEEISTALRGKGQPSIIQLHGQASIESCT